MPGHRNCKRYSFLLMLVKSVAFDDDDDDEDDDRPFLWLNRLVYLEMLRLKLVKSGRYVTRQEQRIASAGSICVHVYSLAMVSEIWLVGAGKWGIVRGTG